MTARPRRIMVAYDGSDAAGRALDAAADLAGYGSTLAVVTVHAGEIDTSTTARSTRAGCCGDTSRLATTRRAESRRSSLWRRRTSSEADLLVIGRRNGDASDFLGSVSSRVVRRAPCDVLVVR